MRKKKTGSVLIKKTGRDKEHQKKHHQHKRLSRGKKRAKGNSLLEKAGAGCHRQNSEGENERGGEERGS